jgi:tetratricopeptide (TPR) repeat protein
MASETPVFLTKVECPICRTINEFETLKMGAYTESDRDTDFCPTGRKWRNPRYQAYNPLLFFTASCTSCHYTREFTNSFKEWKEDQYFKTYRLKTVKEKHLDLLAQPESILKIIGDRLAPHRYPNETAVLKIILAIVDETLNDKQVDLDLGRFYLRIAWIFREMENGENTNQQALKGHLTEMGDILERMRRSLTAVKEQTFDFEKCAEAQFDDEKISAEMKSSLYPIRDKYEAELNSFRELLTLADAKIDSVQDIFGEHKRLAVGSVDGEIPLGFHEFPTFHDFLSQLAEKWSGIPRNEKEALELAVKYYKRAYEDGRDIAEGNQQIQASYLIAELSRRIGNFDLAREYFNTTIRNGQEFIYKHKGDQSRTAMARKILELAIEQGRSNLAAAKTA